MKRAKTFILCIAMITMLSSGCMESSEEETTDPPVADAGPDIIAFIVKDQNEQIEIQFDGSNSSGDIRNHFWDFDKNGPFHQDAEGKIVNHIYNDPGNYAVFLKVDDGKNEDMDDADVFINFRQYENSSLEDDGSESFGFPVDFPATRVFGEIRYDPGSLLDNNITIEISDDEGNSTDREGSAKGEREENGKVVKWFELKGDFVLQYEMGTWRANIDRHDSNGGNVDYSLFIEVDYDPLSET